MRILFVGNPIAGRGTARAAADRLLPRLQARGHVVDAFWTDGRERATTLAADAGRGYDCAIAAGGDGTFREVFAGVGDAMPILPMPLGTGNMMARELGIPPTPEALVALVESRAERRIDVGRAGDRPFLAVAGVGFDAMVTESIARSRRGALGYRGYFGPIVRAAWRYRAPRLRVALDGDPEETCGFVVITKIRRYGGLMRISETARLDSGVFEVLQVSPATRRHLLTLGPLALSGRLSGARGVAVRTARHVIVTAEGDGAVPYELDGDHTGTTPVEIRIEPGAARVVAPPPGPGRP